MPTPPRDDDAWTLAGVGVVASVAQTLGHEALGHGTACLLQGGAVTLLAPLWMRCSVTSPALVAAGPAANGLLGLLALALLRGRPPARLTWRLWLWWSLAFNWLVAAGYLGVGGLTGFGDWAVLLSGVEPDWLWRVPAVLFAAGAYVLGLRVLSPLLSRLLGTPGLEAARLRRLVLAPAGAAAVVAVAAEVAGRRMEPLGLGLALGTTAVVGWSLLGLPGQGTPPPGPAAAAAPRVGRSWAWLVAGLLTALLFIFLVGPGVRFDGLHLPAEGPPRAPPARAEASAPISKSWSRFSMFATLTSGS
jgi:hypothetical protein